MILLIFLLFSLYSFEEPCSSEEDVVKTDTLLWQQEDTGLEIEELPENHSSAGIDVIISEKTKVMSIPLSYRFSKRVSVEIGIPYVRKKFERWDGTEYINSGIGDISLLGRYELGEEERLKNIFSFIFKFPTGDEGKGIGTGSFDFGLFLVGIKRVGVYRFFVNTGYRVNGVDKDDSLETDYGDVFTFLIGGEYFFKEDLRPFVKFRFVNNFESKRSSLGYTWGLWDDVKIGDIIVGLRLKLFNLIGFSLGIEIPVFTEYNENISSPEERKPVMSIKGYKTL
ncbi:MAG: hypothetical protein DRI36_03390 [Caldiserica bacterium]|nr:MAG: hypothetical protein DRI36_03390 [Caldisericota bacterium]